MPLIYFVSLLPFPLLYILSDGFYVLLFYVIGYRKNVVLSNLRKSFPEKTETEINGICKKFYRYFCDLFLETFKTLTIDRKTMLKHCSMDPSAMACFEEVAKESPGIIVVMGHHGNWEWAGNTFSLCCRQQLYVIYHPLENKNFNGLVRRMRERFGTRLIDMKDTFREMVKHRGELTATAFIADQAPNPDNAWWMEFMNQDTPVFMGTEKIAAKLKYPVVFVGLRRIKRGFYNVFAERLNIKPEAYVQEGAITALHTQKLESDIRQQPETWLWSHRRWKHARATFKEAV